MSKEKPKGKFNYMPHMCLDLTAEQAADYIRDYREGGKYFKAGTTDRTFQRSRNTVASETSPPTR